MEGRRNQKSHKKIVTSFMDDLSFSMHGVIAGERQLSKYVVFVIFYNAVSGSLIV